MPRRRPERRVATQTRRSAGGPRREPVACVVRSRLTTQVPPPILGSTLYLGPPSQRLVHTLGRTATTPSNDSRQRTHCCRLCTPALRAHTDPRERRFHRKCGSRQFGTADENTLKWIERPLLAKEIAAVKKQIGALPLQSTFQRSQLVAQRRVRCWSS